MIKNISILIIAITAFIGIRVTCQVQISEKTVHVNGYYRSDGTYVHGYDRRSPGVAQADAEANEWIVYTDLICIAIITGTGVCIKYSNEITEYMLNKPPVITCNYINNTRMNIIDVEGHDDHYLVMDEYKKVYRVNKSQ